jgi:3-hydroxybutyrate dehydrogenase
MKTGAYNEALSMKDKIVLVTGAAQGIGWGIAATFLCQGATVLCVDLHKPDDRAMESLGDQAKRLDCYQTDITEPGSVKLLFDEINRKYGRVDILANNAGIIYKDLIEDMDVNRWNDLLQVNLTGVMLMTRATVPLMKKQKWGRIINTASIQAFIGTKVYSAYSASKAGVLGLTKVCAAELAEYHVTVNAICPGFAHTAMADKLLNKISQENGITFEQAFDKLVAPVPQKRLIEPEEIGALALFLASDLSKGITGEAIILSGGLVMH